MRGRMKGGVNEAGANTKGGGEEGQKGEEDREREKGSGRESK